MDDYKHVPGIWIEDRVSITQKKYDGLIARIAELERERDAVNLFLSHLHGAWYEQHFQKPPPLPYPIAHLGHVHFIPSPNKAPSKEVAT